MERSIIHIMLLGLMSCGLLSCGYDKQEYIKYVSDPINGLYHQRVSGDYLLEVQYKPIPYVLFKEWHIESNERKKWNEKKGDLSGLQYYSFSIRRTDNQNMLKNIGSPSAGVNPISYFSFDVEHDFYVIQGHDTLSPELFHWPRQFNLSPRETFLLGFPEQQPEVDRVFIYRDQILGIGTQQFNIQGDNIQSVPNLK